MTTHTPLITRLLVANRGEITRRIFATCRRLGIDTVAVHSDADASLSFVAEAGTAVRLPGNTPTETYLRADLIVDAARRSGADAIHPGYGFLAENADFARAVIDAGLIWVGPSPESITAMGSKIEAKRIMANAGVPLLPDLTPDSTTPADLPVLVKASAGGGGRGMRIVTDIAMLADEVAAARAEAASAFGDDTVFIEPYIGSARHVEVQVVGHADGVVVVGERDCSVQRRHQKVVEEAPAPQLPEATRAGMHAAARAAAAAIDYRGAGTVEFLYDASADRFFFLEMNTRLQVEHPVTELVHGVDLVEWQLRIAEGGALPDDLPAAPSGHAVEVRLYAEDPAVDYQPQSGALVGFDIPHDVAFDALPGAGVRLDSGFVAGDVVGTYYDAMLAKLIAWAPTRDLAIRRLVGALRQARIHGVQTNRDQLVAILGDDTFTAATMSTDWLQTADITGRAAIDADETDRMLLAATAAVVEDDAATRAVQPRVPTGWRNVHSARQHEVFDVGGVEHRIEWRRGRTAIESVRPGDPDEPGGMGMRVTSVEPGTPSGTGVEWRVVVEDSGVATAYQVAIHGARIDVDGPRGHLAATRRSRFVDPADQVRPGSLVAPMPGSVVALRVVDGETVTAGQALLVLEAMKMQHTIAALADGVVAIAVAEGQQVAAGDVLAIVSDDQAATEATTQYEQADTNQEENAS